jgi:formate hydrogenlyase subunit 3/multisubunit Na+/H+ antiporter MnhD subunit
MKKGKTDAKAAPFTMRIAMVLLVVLIVVTGVFFQQIMTYAIEPAAHALLRGLEYSNMVFGSFMSGF